MSTAVLRALENVLVESDLDAVAAEIQQVNAALSATVPSYRGLQLTVDTPFYPVIVTAFVEDRGCRCGDVVERPVER